MTNPRRASRPDLDYQESSDDDIDDSEFEKYRHASKATIKSYTSQDIKALLQDACPDEFKIVFDHGKVPFLSSTGSRSELPFVTTCDKRPQFGKIKSAIPDLRERIFIHIGGEGNNRISLTSGEDNSKVDLAQTILVKPIKPFWYFNSHERVIDEAEYRRLRALTCFLFLQAGHVQTVQYYPRFEEGVQDAVVWYGKGLEVYLRETSNLTNHVNERVRISNTTTQVVEQGREILYSGPTAIPYRLSSDVIERSNVGVAGQPRSKKRKASDEPRDQIVIQMRHHYEKLGEHIAAYELDRAAMERNQSMVKSLQQEASQSAHERDGLKLQLKAKDKETASMRIETVRLNKEIKAVKNRLSGAVNFASHQKEEAAMERLRCDEEEENRITVEKRLEEYLEAQKKMTDMFMGFKK